jgi:uncharacterized membrane-anchored protein
MDHRMTLTEVYQKIHLVEQQLLRLKAGSTVADAKAYETLYQEHRLLRMWASQLRRR